MIITINTQTKTILIEESVQFLELHEFINNFGLQSYTIKTRTEKSSLSDFFKKQNDYLDPYKPPYKPTCEYITDSHTGTTKWTPFGPTED